MRKYILYVLVVIVLAAAGFFYLKNKKSKPNVDNTPINIVESTEDKPHLVGGIYTNPAYGFTLSVPPPLKVSELVEDEGETILIEGEINGVKDFSMQIYISSFDEDVSLTASRINADIPDLKMIEPIEIKTDGVGTVAFFSDETGVRYREIWFVRGFFLYQVLAEAKNDDTTGKIMESWEWMK